MGTELKPVSFTKMDDATAEELAIVLAEAKVHLEQQVADRVLELLTSMKGPTLGYQIDRYDHSLQTATRAFRDGAEEEMVVSALLHDVGDTISPENHSELGASVLQPYVSAKTHWIIKHHGVFQGYYYFHHTGGDRNARERFGNVAGVRDSQAGASQ